MEFASRFIPVAGEVGLLSMLTYFSFYATFFSLAAGFVFFLAAEKRVAPEHRAGMIFSALICGFYHDALRAVTAAQSPVVQGRIIHTVTTWGVYPLGYLVAALLPQVSFNWIHLAFNVADVVNKVGAGVIIYIGAANVLEDRVPKDATQEAREVA